jgi:SAM-dependent methyltransferase
VTEEHVLANRATWDEDAPNWVERGRRSWAGEPDWGIWQVPESELHLLPDLDGLDTIEVGCGTGYVSAWLKRRGARPIGLDNSSEQLKTAKMLQDEFDLHYPLVHADGERPPFRDESFDLAISEYGAAIWCDPYSWIPEAARILRADGRLVFLGNAYLLMLTMPDEDAPATECLQRPHFGMHRFTWPDDTTDSVEFHLPHGDMIRLLRRSGLEVEDLVEIGAPAASAESASIPSDPMATVEWARRWPNEEVWIARKR